MKQAVFTRKQFEALYPTEDVCLQKIFSLKYKDMTSCSKCTKPFKYHKLKNLKLYSCQFCGWNIAPTSNTIFHKSATPLTSWFYAIYLFSVSKNGVSAMELQRHLGCTYKTAWRIAHRVRWLFDTTGENLKNIVELDESYVGGKGENNKRGRGAENKTPVFGMLEKQGNVIAKVVGDTKRKTVMPLIKENIKIGTEIHSDEYVPYRSLPQEGFVHEMVNHGEKEYVRYMDEKTIHVNGLEGFWSQLKRSIHGTYHAVSPKHLQNYVNEFSYRYNQRFSVDPIFFGLLEKVGQKM